MRLCQNAKNTPKRFSTPHPSLIKATTTGGIGIFLDVSWNKHFQMLRLKATIAVQMTWLLKP
jgi:hypothetical protein